MLGALIGDDNVLLFPNDDLLRAETITSSKELMAQRLYVMSELRSKSNKILVAHTSSLTRFLPSPSLFESLSFNLCVGQRINLVDLRVKLARGGYARVGKIDQSMQFASRGDILDIFSVNNPNPVRIEFFDDEIESIRTFDIATQTSNENLKDISITPASDVIFSEEEISRLEISLEQQAIKDGSLLSSDEKDNLLSVSKEDFERIKSGQIHPRNYKYYGYAQREHYSILDYSNFEIIFAVNKDAIMAAQEISQNEARGFLDELADQGKIISHLQIYRNWTKFLESYQSHYLARNTSKSTTTSNLKFAPFFRPALHI
ncbi:MAG: hypothetical protein WC215_02125 [Bacilli bacterium]